MKFLLTQAQLVDKIFLITTLFAKEYNLDTKGLIKTPTPAKISPLQKFFNDHTDAFDCQRANVAKLISLMTKERIQLSVADGEAHLDGWNGALIKPVGKVPNSHNYAQGEPILIYSGSTCLRPTGKTGNAMTDKLEHMAVGSRADVTKWVDQLWEDSPSSIAIVIKQMSDTFGRLDNGE